MLIRHKQKKKKKNPIQTTFSGSVGNGGALSVLSVKLPAVERALDAVAHHSSANAKMSPQMWTISVQNAGLAVFGSKHHQVFPCDDGQIASLSAPDGLKN